MSFICADGVAMAHRSPCSAPGSDIRSTPSDSGQRNCRSFPSAPQPTPPIRNAPAPPHGNGARPLALARRDGPKRATPRPTEGRHDRALSHLQRRPVWALEIAAGHHLHRPRPRQRPPQRAQKERIPLKSGRRRDPSACRRPPAAPWPRRGLKHEQAPQSDSSPVWRIWHSLERGSWQVEGEPQGQGRRDLSRPLRRSR